jgi:hypothetical protein
MLHCWASCSKNGGCHGLYPKVCANYGPPEAKKFPWKPHVSVPPTMRGANQRRRAEGEGEGPLPSTASPPASYSSALRPLTATCLSPGWLPR